MNWCKCGCPYHYYMCRRDAVAAMYSCILNLCSNSLLSLLLQLYVTISLTVTIWQKLFMSCLYSHVTTVYLLQHFQIIWIKETCWTFVLVFPLDEYCLLTNERVCAHTEPTTIKWYYKLPTLSRLAFCVLFPSSFFFLTCTLRNVIYRYIGVKWLDFPFIFVIDELRLFQVNSVVL